MVILIYLQDMTIPWPKWAEALLNKRIAETRLLDYSLASPEYATTLHGIGKEFLNCVNYSSWEPKHGMLLWHKIQRKAEYIRNENQRGQTPRELPSGNIMEQWPSIQTQNISYQDISGHPPAKVWSSSVPTSHTTIVTTAKPSKPNERGRAMAIWNAVDSKTQLGIFKSQLKSAKDPKVLLHELATFCAEVYRKTDVQEIGCLKETPLPRMVQVPSDETQKVAVPRKGNLELGSYRSQVDSVKTALCHNLRNEISSQPATRRRQPRDEFSYIEEFLFPKENQTEDESRPIEECTYKAELLSPGEEQSEDECQEEEFQGGPASRMSSTSFQDDAVPNQGPKVGYPNTASSQRKRPLPDLKTMIEERLHKAQLKRARSKEEESQASKRTKPNLGDCNKHNE